MTSSHSKLKGFTIIEVLIVIALLAILSGILIRKFSARDINILQIASGIAGDIRLAQSYSLGAKKFNGAFRCGYGFHRENNNSYIIYAGRDTGAGNCNPGYNFQNEAQTPTVKRSPLNSGVIILDFSDIFFLPPDPKVFINDSANPNDGPELLTLRKSSASDCTNPQNCSYVCVHFSGRVEVYNNSAQCQ